MRAIAAVVFDIGGVVQDSPLHAIARYERERGLEANAINRVVVAAGEQGAWARLERGELTVQTFYAPFEDDCRARGAHFDVFVESAVVGLRKPDPRIYALVCENLGVEPPRVAFLDDIGRNLKPARELGMATIKVDDPDQALRELGALLGLDLIS